MIRVLGSPGSSEHAVAEELAGALAKLWPGLAEADASEELVIITAGAKLTGYRISDIDVVVAAKLRRGRAFVPKRVVNDGSGKRIAGGIQVSSFVAALEVKDHDPAETRISGQAVEVRYTRSGPPQWHNATEQNVQQMHALRQCLEEQTAGVWVHRAVVLRGYEKPPVPGTLARSFDGAAFLTALVETAPPRQGKLGPYLQAGPPIQMDRVLQAPVFRELRPSSLDRKRMDLLVKRDPRVQEHLPNLGQRLVRFRGRGGSGKTVILLQLAWQAYQQTAARSVVLTFNHALTSDIRRLLALLGVPSGAQGGISVRTVMGFVTSWLAELGVLDGDQDGPSRPDYETSCSQALEMIRQGAISGDDVAAIKQSQFERFDFDYIIADEAQDWPEAELELLKTLYGPEKFCLADGMDQLVRGKPAYWEAGVASSARLTIPLRKCLRMKSNLAVFANAVAERAGLDWQVEPNDQAPGGRIILTSQPLKDQPELIATEIERAVNQGNAPVDLLICVPPSDVEDGPSGRRSRLAAALAQSGREVWDATSLDDRKDFPRGTEALRVVQYGSCRGLEGWTVFLDHFDDPHAAGFAHDPEASWTRRLVPLTRGMDTLVIALENPKSEVTRILRAVARSHPDLVQTV